MKLGIIGLPGSGKTTVFRALTGGIDPGERKGHQEPGVGVVRVHDERMDFLADYHKPKKVTPVHVEYLDIHGMTGEGKAGRSIGDAVLAHIRAVDALIHCVRDFDSSAQGPADPIRDFRLVRDEMIISDMAVVEKRLERIEKDVKKGRKELQEELDRLREAHAILDAGHPLLSEPRLLESETLRGFAFLTAKPQLVLLNAGENRTRRDIANTLARLDEEIRGVGATATDWLYADIEAEIARLDEGEAQEFLQDLDLDEGALTRIIRKSFQLLNLIVFFTCGEPDVHAWPLRRGLTALKAAGTIHSDLERGFIRAEVVSFADFKEAGSSAAAHKAGKVRLEGRDYEVKDGDIILIRFNV